jgi:ATP-dependent RNA helicase DHX57
VILVTGDTGCGKTTQIPQFILEEAPDTVKIVVAQPRRLAATGIAGRVAQERGEDKAGTGSVGYVVRGDSAYGKNTRLLFCTFGILLRQLQCNGALDCITHIVIDEVHERNLDCDVLMALLRHALKTTPNLRVVLMSATLDADRFAAYWGENTSRLHIPGRTFPVEDFMLEDVLDLTGYIPPKKGKKKLFNYNSQSRPRKSTPWNDSEVSDGEDQKEEEESQEEKSSPKTGGNFGGNVPPLEERVKRVDEAHFDYDMLGQLVKYIIRNNTMGNDGSILVFLPGAPEINQAKTAIGRITGGLNVILLPLHGGLPPKDQNAVFRSYGNDTKVILSTNVAETSITIPGCTVVIDTCREKQSTYDPTNRMPMLVEHFASKASLKQRRGRAGRVRPGKCYKLISKATHSKLPDHTAPEITRCALDQTLLSLLFLGVERGNGTFLRNLLDPPSQGSVDAAIFSLWKVGALEHWAGKNELRLTPLGMHLAGIPAPPVVGKILVMGSILGCRRAALAMAAGISTGRSPFLKIDLRAKQADGSTGSMQEAKQRHVLDERAKLLELSGNSDHAMLATAFMQWESLKTGGGERKSYCDSLGLSFTGIRDILQLVNQYDSSLSSAGFVKSAESDRNTKSFRILRSCAISSMAPGQLVRVHRPSTKYADTAEGAREKDGVAKELKFFIRNQEAGVPWQSKINESTSQKDERVFLHPSSALFSVGNFSCPWLVYNSMVKTSKPFLRDATECSAYALLLFGGQLDVQARNGIIVIDDWVKLSANARIGALIRGLRGRMDNLLEEKIKDPKSDISNTPEMELIVKLLITDGLGN